MAELEILPAETMRKLVSYNPETGALTWKPRPPDDTSRANYKTWNARFSGKAAFTTVGAGGYLFSEVFNRPYRAHRVIWAIVHGVWPEAEIDHINGVRTDNRLCNLRMVSRQENNRNMGLSSRNTSGVTGVTLDKQVGRWRAQITVDQHMKYLGRFPTFKAAVKARKQAERRHGFHKNHGSPR